MRKHVMIEVKPTQIDLQQILSDIDYETWWKSFIQ